MTMLMLCCFENQPEIFFDVLRRIENSIGKLETDRLLEMTTVNGQSAFSFASSVSTEISQALLKRGIKLNTIGLNFDTPSFKFKHLVPELIKARV